MRTCDGLSLTEVLVSLFLVTSVSLVLIQQYAHISQFTRQINRRSEAMRQLDNASEQLLAHHHEGFHCKTKHLTSLKAFWDSGDIKRVWVK